MIETDEQRRWWFATHPEYSWSLQGRESHREQKENAEDHKVRPEDVDAYVDNALKYVHGPVADLLRSVKKWFGTEGDSPERREELGLRWEAEGGDRLTRNDGTPPVRGLPSSDKEAESDDTDHGRHPAHEDFTGPFTYDQGLKDGMRWALDPKRGLGPPRVLNPEYLDGFTDGVTEVWKHAQATTETWNRLSEAAADTWDTLASWLPFVGGGTLGKNLEKALGQPKPLDHAEHHIVPKYDRRFPEAIEARDILEGFDIPFDHAANGAFLPNKLGVGSGAYHPGLHTRRYYRNLVKSLRKATSREDAIRILHRIGSRLSNGTFPK